MTDPTPPAPEPAITAALQQISTATITTLLLKQGLRNIWVRRARPLREGQPRTVGPAFTLRFVPAREDLANPAAWSSPRSTRMAVEAMPAGCIAVADAMGVTDAGVLGDILAARMVRRGVRGLVTDGAVLIPQQALDTVLRHGPEQERLEAWTLAEVLAGAALPGLYPPDEAALRRWRAQDRPA